MSREIYREYKMRYESHPKGKPPVVKYYPHRVKVTATGKMYYKRKCRQFILAAQECLRDAWENNPDYVDRAIALLEPLIPGLSRRIATEIGKEPVYAKRTSSESPPSSGESDCSEPE